MARKLRIGVVQMRSGLEAPPNRAAVTPLLRQAAAAGARLIATPECTTKLDRNRSRFLGGLLGEKGADQFAGGNIPYLHKAVEPAGRKLCGIGRESDGPNIAFMAAP